MKKRLDIILLAFTFIIIFIESNHAQITSISFATGDSLFLNMKKTKTTSNYIELYDSEDIATPIAIYQFNTEKSYYLLNGFAIVGNLTVMYPHGFRFSDNREFEVRKTCGIGISGMVRYEFIKLYGHNFYVEMGPGFLLTTQKFPPLGTIYNFTQRYGFGMNIPVNRKVIIIFGVRHMHISNGKGFVQENPQYNGNGIYLGVKLNAKDK